MDAAPSWTPPNSEYPPPKPGEPPFHRAARTGDHDAIRSLVAAGTGLDEPFDIGLDPGAIPWPATPLMVAAGSGDGATVETVQLLLSLGADPKVITRAGSAARFAARGLGWNYRPGGDSDRLSALLGAGCPLPIAGEEGSRLVADTAALGDAARLAVLLGHGAPVNPHFDPAEARRKHQQFKEYMRRYESDWWAGAPEELRRSMEESSAEREREEAARAESAPPCFEIPLFQAAASGSLECVRLLLQAGANVHQLDDCKETALWHACSPDIARLLVEHGLRLQDSNWLEWTPLMSNLGDPARVKALIAAGADVNATSDQGYTVFMSAVGSDRNPEVLQILVASGADPHAVSDLGYNAFHAAIDVNGEANAESSVRSTFLYLRELGVDIEHRNNAGHTPLARALEFGTGVEARVLCEVGADPNVVCRRLVCGDQDCGSVEAPLVFGAISAGVHPDQKVNALIRCGARLDVRDDRGLTPLQHAESRLAEIDSWEDSKSKDKWLAEGRRCLSLLRQAGSP